MADGRRIEDLLRDAAPRVLGAVVRRHGRFDDAEDAVQEAMLAAAERWPRQGIPEDPGAWLIRVASRRMADQHRSGESRRRREERAGARVGGDAWPAPAPPGDDSLLLLLLCCHPSLTPGAAIPLTLRAVGGLSTREIAAAFLVPEATMAQRISRAKAKVAEAVANDPAPFALPDDGPELSERLRSVLHVLYLMFNEGYAATEGRELARAELSTEAIRLTRGLHAELPDDPEATGLLALMLLTEARRPARTSTTGELVPLDRQDRTRWDRALIAEGVALITGALRAQRAGEYQLQAAIAAVHDQSPSPEQTDWGQINALYRLLERLTDNPMVRLNRAAALGASGDPEDALHLLDGLEDRLGEHFRLHAVRGRLLELSGRPEEALVEVRAAAAKAGNEREQQHLLQEATRLAGTLG